MKLPCILTILEHQPMFNFRRQQKTTKPMTMPHYKYKRTPTELQHLHAYNTVNVASTSKEKQLKVNTRQRVAEVKA